MRTTSITLIAGLGACLFLAACSLPSAGTSGEGASQALVGTSTITINSSTSTGAMMWGATGFLYGLSESPNLNGYTLSDSMLTGLVHLGYTSQKAPWGAQHPDGDALNVAVQFKRVGGKGVGIYVQDYYAQWPYPNNGISSYITNVVDKVCASVVADPNRKFMHYVPFNEPDWIWYSPSGTLFNNFLADWKTVFNRIRADDPGAVIAGPNFSTYNNTAYTNFMTYAKANNVLPDIITWHELDGSLFTGWYTHYNNFRQIETNLGLAHKPIFINEYARSSGDLNVPGNLVQYITRFENSKVYGGLAFWTGIGDLNDLVANNNTSQSVPGSSLNQPDGAWYLYQWYGQMSGNTVQVVLPSQNGSLQALAAKNGNSIRAIFGGSLNATDTFNVKFVVNGLSGSSATYKVLATNNTGRSPAPAPATILSGTATVSGGSMTLTVNGCKALSAYNLQIN